MFLELLPTSHYANHGVCLCVSRTDAHCRAQEELKSPPNEREPLLDGGRRVQNE